MARPAARRTVENTLRRLGLDRVALYFRDDAAVLGALMRAFVENRVKPYYLAWLERFPTIADLAAAPTADVISLWAGLGYNRRALNLWRTARIVVEEHGGVPRGGTALHGGSRLAR